MGSEYDRKFQEMKKYIPFLESMIQRLESNSSSSNPRQAQLDKIRSLRDLLLDKKKRMKMDNLLKCEQVLVNLYAKVEHTRDSIPLARIEKNDSHTAEDADLSVVRNKLKSFTKSMKTTETLPEIARASEREEICEPGSKEPALFQRRPNKSSLSPVNYSPRKSNEAKSPKGQSKRYTRVLVSPDRQRRWSGNEETSMESALFSRRSPRPSRRTSPSFHKKERKKSIRSKDRLSHNENHENFNITLKVPEDKLHSLNTDDIISRIITCSDGDVDIATLRELRTQILGELKQTGKNDDISELILKSYNKKNKPKKKKKHEVEEGEISDSESEIIDSVYGSLAVVLDKDKKQGQSITGEKSNQQRKIQICLVLNSEKEGDGESKTEMDLSETGVFQNEHNDFISLDSEPLQSPHKKNEGNKEQDNNYDIIKDSKADAEIDKTQKKTETCKPHSTHAEVAGGEDKTEHHKPEPEISANDGRNKTYQTENNDNVSETPTKNKDSVIKTDVTPSKIPYSPSDVFASPNANDDKLREPKINIANFYTTPSEDIGRTQLDKSKDATLSNDCLKSDTAIATAGNKISDETKTNDIEIPLLNEPHLPPKAKKDVLSEIDILQALKNEILSETIPIASTEADTPALHKPKLTKVTSGTETSSLKPKATSSNIETSSVPINKKRISIENYKKKSETVNATAKSLFVKKRSNAEREEMRKQSLKLTEKECERFNLTRLSLDDEDDYISDYDLLEDDKPLSLDDIYANLAPESPDQDHFDEDIDIPVPTEIPTDPMKPPIASIAADVDMRSSATSKPVLPPMLAVTLANIAGTSKSTPITDSKNFVPEGNRKPPADPRLRRDLSQPASKDSPKAYKPPSLEGTPRPSQYPNIPPVLGMAPAYTPSYAPSMTPIRTPNARSYEMTPTHQSFDIEEARRKHVYAPSFSLSESREREFPKDRPVWELNKNTIDNIRSRKDIKNTRWETNQPKNSPIQRDPPSYNPRNDKYFIDRRDSYSKQDGSSTPGPSIGRSDGTGTTGRLEAPMTPSHPFGRSDCPSTPIHPFGRSDCPTTPSHPFGRSDCPSTPIHPFGRSDCPTTPSHPFGRSDCPSTPIHPFGRSDCPTTPSHPFGRSECPTTPSHPFGRSDYKDPRFNRKQSEHESRALDDDRDRGYNRSNSYRSHSRQFGEDSPRNYDREQRGITDRYSNDPYRYSKSNVTGQQHLERELSFGRSDKSFAKDLSGRYDRTRHEFSQKCDNNLFTRDRDRHCDYENSRRNRGESMIEQNRSSRAQSVGRTDYDNSLSVKAQIGHTFTIDTSVNATFQKLLENAKGVQAFDTMDSRRQRATSVGRSLVCDNRFGLNLPHEETVVDTTFIDRRKRASSVGRSLVNDKKDKKMKTLTEIKADFKSYQVISFNASKSANASYIMSNQSGTIRKETRESRSTRKKYDDSQDAKLNTKPPYSPTKNYRDPRMRKEIKDPRNKNERNNSHSYDRRHSGIVYSNDNIAKGTIMGTGFGVKNYKIPKIKKLEPERPKTPVEDPKKLVKEKTSSVNLSHKKNKQKAMKNIKSDDEESETVIVATPKTQSKKEIISEKCNDKKPDSLKNKNNECKDRVSQRVISSDDESEVRLTRSSKKSETTSAEKTFRKTRRVRQIVDDSDSEEAEIKNYIEIPHNKSKTKLSKVSTKQNDFEDPTLDKDSDKLTEHTKKLESDVSSTETMLRKTLEGDESCDSSFGIEDIEMFPDSIVTGPDIGINDILENLDKHISDPKSTKDSNNVEMEKNKENMLCELSEQIKKDLNDSNNEKFKQDLKDTSIHNLTTINSTAPIVPPCENQNLDRYSITQVENASTTITQPTSCNEKLNSNDETVSTTQFQSTDSNQIVQDENKLNEDILTTPEKGHSAPDSTIVQSNDLSTTPEASLPDSTIEIHSEVSSDVTSTLNDTKKDVNESTEQPAPSKEMSAIESFGSLLTMLQDKSKIKELLLLLGEKSGDTEKIKKKLEKLSEIVSDEDDANNEEQKDCGSNSLKTTESRVTEKDVENQRNDEVVNNEISVIEVANQRNDEVFNKEKPVIEKELEKVENELVKDSKKIDDQSEKIGVPDLENANPIVGKAPGTTLENNDDPEHDDQINDEMTDEHDPTENQDEEVHDKTLKTSPKKGKGRGRNKLRSKKGKFVKKVVNYKNQSNLKLKEIKPIIKKTKANRELKTLQNDLKEMFISNEVMNATGIRMCRLAKLVDKKREPDTPPEDEQLHKSKDIESAEETVKKVRKKPGPKPKPKIETESTGKKHAEKDVKIDKPKISKPGPKSKTKQNQEADPYQFDTDSMADTNTTKESDAYTSDSESDTGVSSTSESSEVLADIKRKPKKKRGNWQTGVIKPKHKKKKDQNVASTSAEVIKPLLPLKPFSIPDLNCFTDKMYCFQRGVVAYDCRICHYSGTEIVSHYKKQHAHTEVPLSRMDPNTAKKAIEQCEKVNFQFVSKIASEKYVCRFCYKEFSKNKVALENFFWHVVSTHTGEYKQLCYECVNATRCPFNLDIPPPPKEIKGQLIGYICGRCNFTQISLENLKTHVIVRHNDEQTEVYTINLGVMSNKALKAMLRKSGAEELGNKPRTLRSSRSNVSLTGSDDRSEISGSEVMSDISSTFPKQEDPDPHVEAAVAKIKRKPKPGPLKSKLKFEIEYNDQNIEASVKSETELDTDNQNDTSHIDDTTDMNESFNETEPLEETPNDTSELDQTVQMDQTKTIDTEPQHETVSKADTAPSPKATSDIFELPHFKVNYKDNGSKEYICCVNGEQNHYKTSLLISLKKHLQSKHSEKWDGYCCACKVIVTLQGVQSNFKDCLTHFLDKHMDDFPIMERIVDTVEDSRSSVRSSIDASSERTESPSTYLTVRPLSDLISQTVDSLVSGGRESPFPVIDNMVSFSDRQTVKPPQTSPVYPSTSTEVIEPQPVKPFQYEEVQAKVMSNKHRIVLDTMMAKEVLVRVFKCAGHFCSFTSDSAEDALVHASAHKQLGGEGALDCAYCNFDAAGNAIDLVMHVFKAHGRCQFSCVLCFYRAAADKLVIAHFRKAHGSTKPVAVLRATSFLGPVSADTTDMLPRETAVPYYICNHGEGICKLRTYAAGKYFEHLQQKHANAESHPCNLCEVSTPTPADLVKHMKDHALNLYQCTWCVHGADNEAEMLCHAATKHPTKNPQAYLRMITKKDTEFRMLPLIHLNTIKVPVEDVIPLKVNENPTKEAERSIALEKLISFTPATINTAKVPEKTETPEDINPPTEIIEEPEDITNVQTSEAIENSLLSSPQKKEVLDTPSALFLIKNQVSEHDSEAVTLNQKTETIVYCLDSDDEEVPIIQAKQPSEQVVIDLSDEELADEAAAAVTEQPVTVSEQAVKTNIDKPTFKKLPLDQLFKCPVCSSIFQKVGFFKRHTNTCCLELVTIRCPHDPCPIVVTNITQLINHYSKDHNALNVAKQYYCGECNIKGVSLAATKKHLKECHNITKVTIATLKEDNGTYTYKVNKELKPAPREIPKRNTPVESPKVFGIADIDKLPLNPILDSLVYCSLCKFSTKVRLNMVRHLQLHAEKQHVPHTAPVNPVPHLVTNEKHFDRMVNLASSSAATRPEQRPPGVATETVTRYPKYVPDRQRLTCGAKGCAYISVDETMLRHHWNTLHTGTVDFHCVHCPPIQHLNTSKPLTANRIIAHLNMHDADLYACSSCSYYHHKKQIVESHITDVHKEKGQLQVVREGGVPGSVPAPTASVGSVGTMDLKPWQCGLCEFKNMLRQSVVEHCSQEHQTKMQYKCSYCPFRTSGIENVVKHQSKAHTNRPEDVFYYYYREGTVPDEADGTPRWKKQCQEREQESTPVEPLPKTVPVDLNLVKKEVEDADMSVEELCKMYGQFCEPNGISYKCPLCKIVSEYTREAMQSHLFEELKYRRWSCAICPYKAYHKTGLNEHMIMEHGRNFIAPTELPVKKNIEKWVTELLNYQSCAIEKSKTNPLLADMTKNKPKAVEKPVPGPSKIVVAEPVKSVQAFPDNELQQAFGVFGVPKDDSYCCPKCNVNIKAEDEMRNHLESELTKIRWCCTKCTDKFPTFHEAQYHCKSHPGPLTRPKEAVRDPALRSAWVSSVLTAQKKSMKPDIAHTQPPQDIDLSDTSENSLLVVRYEEPVSTDELTRHIIPQTEESRKRPAESDSDDSNDGMTIYEPESKKLNDRNCPYCDFVSRSDVQYKVCLKEHILRHFNLGILTCVYCNFNGTRRTMRNHVSKEHPDKPPDWKQTDIPNCIPSQFKLRARKEKIDGDVPTKVCLHCEDSVPISELQVHVHGNKISEFKDKGEVVAKCCICLNLRPDLEAMKVHYKQSHPDITKLNYAYYKLQIDTREVHSCAICSRRFTFLRDLRIHHSTMHSSHNLSYTTVPFRPDEDDHDTRKRKLEEASSSTNRLAKKSTSKLPQNKIIAKKSTTKLPLICDSDSDSEDEYSYYGSKPSSIDKYEKVKTKMSMYNTMVEIDVKKLSGLLKINPQVVVKDIKK